MGLVMKKIRRSRAGSRGLTHDYQLVEVRLVRLEASSVVQHRRA